MARKWATLEDAFKKIKDNNKSTVQGVIKLNFYSEMEELIGSKHDIDFPVIGDAMNVQIKKAEALRKDSSRPSSPWPSDVSTQHSSSSSRPPCETSCKSACFSHQLPQEEKIVGQHELLNFLKEFEEATQRRNDEIMM